MKTKLTLLILLTALVTFSFSYGLKDPKKSDSHVNATETSLATDPAPVGGFVSER